VQHFGRFEFLGAGGLDQGNGIAVRQDRNAYITGATASRAGTLDLPR